MLPSKLFRPLLLALFLAGNSAASAQVDTSYSLLYKPTLDQLQRYVKKGNSALILEELLNSTAVDTIYSGEGFISENFPKGVYVEVRAFDGKLAHRFHNNVDYEVSVQTSIAHVVYSIKSNDTTVKDAVIYTDFRKPVQYSEKFGGYPLKLKMLDYYQYFLVQVGDQYFVGKLEENRLDSWWYNSRYRFPRPGFTEWLEDKSMGFIAFNKPMYRPGDTLQFKVVYKNKWGKPIRGLTFKLSSGWGNQQHTITDVTEIAPGSYMGWLVIGDSLLESGYNYLNVYNENRLLNDRLLKVEEYNLKTAHFKSELKEERGEFNFTHPIKISYTLKNDLGFSSMGGKILLTVTGSPSDFGETYISFPDIVYDTIITVDPTGTGIIVLGKDELPSVKSNLKVLIQYIPDIGLVKEESGDHYVVWNPEDNPVEIKYENGDWVLWSNRSSAEDFSIGLTTYNGRDTVYKDISLPYVFTGNELRADWQVFFNGQPIHVEVPNTQFKLWGEKKGKEFQIYSLNPVIKPVEYSAVINRKLYRGELFNDTVVLPKGRRFEFRAGGEGIYMKRTPWYKYLRSKLRYRKDRRINIDVNSGPSKVRPGEITDWDLTVKSKNQKVKNQDVLVLAYKKQQFDWSFYFNTDAVHVDFPRKRYRLRSGYSINLAPVQSTILDRDEDRVISQDWYSKLSLDTIATFSRMFPNNGLEVHYDSLQGADLTAQFAPLVFDGGRTVRVEYFTIDDEMKYINRLSKWDYSSFTTQGSHTIGIRIHDRMLWVPNVPMKDGYKTELAVDLQNLPDSVVVKGRPSKYTNEELMQILPTVGVVSVNRGENLIATNGKEFRFRSYYSQSLNIAPLDSGEIRVALGDDTVLVPVVKNDMSNEYWVSSMKSKVQGGLYSWSYAQPSGEQLAPLIKEVSLEKELSKIDVQTHKASLHERFEGSLNIDWSLIMDEMFIVHNQLGEVYRPEWSRYNNQIPLPIGRYTILAYLGDEGYIMNDVPIDLNHTTYLNADRFIEVTFDQLKETLESIETTKNSFAQLSSYELEDGSTGLQGYFELLLSTRSLEESTVYLSKDGVVQDSAKVGSDDSFSFANTRPGVYDLQLQVDSNPPVVFEDVLLLAGHESFYKFNIEQLLIGDTLVVDVSVPGPTKQKLGYASTKTVSSMVFGAFSSRAQGVVIRGNATLGLFAEASPAEELQSVVVVSDLAMRVPRAKPNELDQQEPTEKTEALANLAAQGETNRENFRDYAYFIPDVVTDKDGNATVEVQFPDDVAKWTTEFVVLAEGKKFGRAMAETKAYYEVMASLGTPKYLVAGDSAMVIGKSLNYLDTTLKVINTMSVDAREVLVDTVMLSSSVVQYAPVVADDSAVKVKYAMALENGFVDSETRTIEVIPAGVELSEGDFFRLQGDTSWTYNAGKNAAVTVGVMQSLGAVYQREIDLQRNYRHSCNEQVASKLHAVLLAYTQDGLDSKEKRTYKAEAKKLITKLEKAQNHDYSWGWWPNQDRSHWVTTYVMEVLLAADAAGFNVDASIAVPTELFEMPGFPENDLVNYLRVYLEYGWTDTVKQYIPQIHIDSLKNDGVLKYAIICDELGLAYNKEKVLNLFNQDVLGNWYVTHNWKYSLSGSLHNTVLGAEWLLGQGMESEARSTLDYALVMRGSVRMNTVDRAALLKLIKRHGNHVSTEASSFVVQWENGRVDTVSSSKALLHGIGNLKIQKLGSGTAFVSVSESYFDPNPALNNESFAITSSFDSDDLTVGDKVNLVTQVHAPNEARYVMIEIPIPANCIVDESRLQHYFGWNSHVTVGKDRVYVFLNQLNGDYTFSLPLFVRYAGEFTVNPAKVELMYFPMVNGNNEKSSIQVVQQ